MNQTISRAGSHPFEMMAVIADAIQTVSPRARETAITSESLLLEELALDSLDLVAVILRLQDHFQVEIDPEEIPVLRSVGDLVACFSEELRSAA
jgi:acyl carrier protein